MEQLIDFNGVKVLLTTGQSLSEVQNHLEEADLVISVYSHEVRILRRKFAGRIVMGTLEDPKV